MKLKPDVIVEVGSDQGYNTRNLLNFCRSTRATLHAIDPLPKFDVAEWQKEYPDTFVFHEEISLEALRSISNADLVLIDGDHNWYTVFHELKTLEELAGDDSNRYPVVLLHDVGWPYGRRDLYYDPDRIPEPHRHPHRRAGLRPQRSDLDNDGGLNRHLFNAVQEGGPRNGVLTAVEDFLEETALELEYVQVHGIHDLGILFPTELKSRNSAITDFLGELTSGGVLSRLLERVEAFRINSSIEAVDHKGAYEDALSLIAKLRTDLESIRDERNQRVAELRGRDRQVDNRINSLEQERDQIAAQAKRLRDELGSYERTVKARNDQIEQLTNKVDQIEADKLQIATQLLRLKGRRSIRLALRLANVTKPMIRMWRRARKPLTQAGGGREETSITQTPQVSDTVHPQLSGPGAVGSADIVVCIHNAEEDVRACLDSIVATTNLVNHGLILVDDGSDEPVRTLLQNFASRYPVQLIRNAKAKGYTVAANQGIAASEHPNVVLLNSDTVVGPGWLEKLIRCAEVMPDTAVVGPYSNAASWQSVPVLTTADGNWHVNPLPNGASPSDVAAMVDRWSPRIYPEVPLINGFCYLITRRALDQVGPLDEHNFPRGYGEEDDFSLRCAEAGLKLYVADDAYVYHAKSRSFTPESRKTIVVESKETLRRKYGADRFKGLVDNIRTSEDLIRSRTFVGGAIERGDAASERDFIARRPLVGWLQPHLAEAGGIRRAIEMTNRLSRWGCRSVLITPDGWRTDWLTVLAEVISVEAARSMEFDVLIVSDPDMIWPFLELSAARKINYHLDSYMLYRAVDEVLEAYYARTSDGVINVANSKWTAQQVQAHSDLGVEAIFPGGVDKHLFYPMRIEKSHDVVCHGSLRERKSTETIEQACFDLSLLKMEDRKVKQQHLARLINSGRVFVSASWLEGFNLSALEAMACGVPVVMTDDGGSREYAVDGENALVVEPKDATGLREQILRLRDDPPLRAHLIENGLRTAWAYDWDSTTAQFADFLFGRGEATARTD